VTFWAFFKKVPAVTLWSYLYEHTNRELFVRTYFLELCVRTYELCDEIKKNSKSRETVPLIVTVIDKTLRLFLKFLTCRQCCQLFVRLYTVTSWKLLSANLTPLAAKAKQYLICFVWLGILHLLSCSLYLYNQCRTLAGIPGHKQSSPPAVTASALPHTKLAVSVTISEKRFQYKIILKIFIKCRTCIA
jgi:hypothetical protein